KAERIPRDSLRLKWHIGESALGFAALGRAHQLGLWLRRRGLEIQLLLAVDLVDFYGDRVLAVERALEQLLRQWVFEQVLDGAPERASAEFEAGTLVDDEVLGFFGED